MGVGGIDEADVPKKLGSAEAERESGEKRKESGEKPRAESDERD